jgi:hypothetical protein
VSRLFVIIVYFLISLSIPFFHFLDFVCFVIHFLFYFILVLPGARLTMFVVFVVYTFRIRYCLFVVSFCLSHTISTCVVISFPRTFVPKGRKKLLFLFFGWATLVRDRSWLSHPTLCVQRVCQKMFCEWNAPSPYCPL